MLEPRSSHVSFAGEQQNLDHRQPTANRVFVNQARRGDRSVVCVGAKHDQGRDGLRTDRSEVADVHELAVRTAASHGIKQRSTTKCQWSELVADDDLLMEAYGSDGPQRWPITAK